MTRISYAALPTSAFTTLQKQVFPVYFRLQALLILVTALTYPPPPHDATTTTNTTTTTTSILALLDAPVADSGLLAFAGATAVANWLKYGPATAEAMIARTHQATRDGRRKHDDGGPAGMSEEMRARKRAFSRNHAMSIHLNLLVIGAALAYGVRLAGRMRF
ncbi:hypothetical protein SLS54_005176 [Diplodia seriata]